MAKNPDIVANNRKLTNASAMLSNKKNIIRTIISIGARIDGITAEHAANREQAKTHEHGKRKREWATFWALLVAAGAAIVTLIVSHCDNRSIVYESDRIARQQHADTVAALAETKRQADIADQALHSVQRAYITVSEFRINTIPNEDPMKEVTIFSPIIKNSGNTPATDMSIITVNPHTEYIWWLQDLRSPAFSPAKADEAKQRHLEMMCPDDPDTLFPRKDKSAIPGTFVDNSYAGPGAIITPIMTSGELRFGDINKIYKHEIGGFFYGEIRYKDIFHVDHITKYCYDVGLIEVNPNRFLPQQCSHWNCMDQDCEADKKAYERDLANYVPLSKKAR